MTLTSWQITRFQCVLSDKASEREREIERTKNVNKGAKRLTKRVIGASRRTHAHKWMLYCPTHYHRCYSCFCAHRRLRRWFPIDQVFTSSLDTHFHAFLSDKTPSLFMSPLEKQKFVIHRSFTCLTRSTLMHYINVSTK